MTGCLGDLGAGLGAPGGWGRQGIALRRAQGPEKGRAQQVQRGQDGNWGEIIQRIQKPGRGLDRELSDVQMPPPKEATQVMGVQQCWETEEPQPSGKEISVTGSKLGQGQVRLGHEMGGDP